MLPMPDSFLLFVAAIFPLGIVLVILHEAGHAFAARLAGVRVLAWGVGIQNPRLRLKLGRSFFYVGRPLLAGLTIHCRQLFEVNPRQEFITVLGGPLASLLGLFVGVAAWRRGVHSDILLSWIYLSAFYCLSAWIPRTFHRNGMTFNNDAKLLLDLARHGDRGMCLQPYGVMLDMQSSLATLLEQVGHRPGAGYVRLAASNLAAGVGASDVAQRWWDEAQSLDLEEMPTGRAMSDFVRSAIAVEAQAPDALALLDVAAQSCRGSASAEFYLAANRSQLRQRQGESVGAELETLQQQAFAANKLNWQALIAHLKYEADPTIAPAALDAMLARYEPQLPDVSRARMLALAVERLAASGDVNMALARFEPARQAALKAARHFAKPELREIYLAQACVPLRAAHQACPERIPDWDPEIVDAVAVDADVVNSVAGRRPLASMAAEFLGFCLLCLMILIVWRTGRSSISPAEGERRMMLALGGGMVCLLAGLCSLVRREGRAGACCSDWAWPRWP